MTIPSAPTGLTTGVFKNRIVIKWIKNPETDIKGYNVYNTTTSGGGLSGYVKLNNVLIEEYSEVQTNVLNSESTVSQLGSVRTTTIVDTLEEVYIYSYEHENLTEDRVEYYVVTAVNTIGEEGPMSIEVGGTPFLITTEVVPPILRTQNDVSLDYITTLLEREPLLDVKPGSVTRQLHVDPNSYEFSLAYVRIDFESRAQSFLTLRQIDDSDDNGISDPVADSTYKQLLKTAYFFNTDDETQAFIDAAFDKLAANSGTFREGALQATGTVVFYTVLPPSKSITVPMGTTVGTVPTETTPSINFTTLSDVIMDVNYLTNYYNSLTQRYEITANIQAVIADADGNVNANTIVNTSFSGLAVTNVLATFGGRDKETNASLADRAQISYLGLDLGTAYGYKRTVAAIPSVTDAMIVSAGDPLMQRDYDEVRNKHVYGKVDIYVRGSVPVQYQDTVGFLFKQNLDEQFDIIDDSDMIIRTPNTEITSVKAIYSVSTIFNLTKGELYDLTGNWTVYKNTIEMIKTTEVLINLPVGEIVFVDPLTTGDVITADYDYTTDITDEVLIGTALGGETDFWLVNTPIAKYTYKIYRNGTELIDVTQYTLDLTTGFLRLNFGLTAGDRLTADYQYITQVIGEVVIASASGGEQTADLANDNVVASLVLLSDGKTIDINETNVINAAIGMDGTDVIKVTYRYRDSDPIVLLNQPVDSVTSITGSISGALTADVNYTFEKVDDILLEGNSVRTQRYVNIFYANGVPAGDMLDGEEDVVMVNNEFSILSQKGVDVETLAVKIGATTYVKNVDYLIRSEAEGINVSIARSITTSIPNGATVSVSYEYGELLTIVYNTNPLIAQVQEVINTHRHITADVLVKGCLETKIDFAFSVVINTGADSIRVVSDIRTAISNEINRLKLGEGVAQSDIIRAIELVHDVKSVLVPLTKMVKADDTQINREVISTTFIFYQSSVVSSYTTGINALLQKTLGSNAGDGFYSVFQDDIALTLVTDANNVDNAAGQAFISSNGEVIISTISGDSPSAHTYTVSYVVNGETGARDIVITSLEFLSVGEVLITTVYG